MVGGHRFVFLSLFFDQPRLEGPLLDCAQIELVLVAFLDAPALPSAGLDSALRDSTFLDGRQALVMFYP